MPLNFEIVLLICSIGFVTAALFVAMMADVDPLRNIDLAGFSLFHWMLAVPVAAFGGPYWVARESIHGIFRGRISVVSGSAGLVISLVWSFCAGVFVVEFLHLLQLV